MVVKTTVVTVKFKIKSLVVKFGEEGGINFVGCKGRLAQKDSEIKDFSI